MSGASASCALMTVLAGEGRGGKPPTRFFFFLFPLPPNSSALITVRSRGPRTERCYQATMRKQNNSEEVRA